LLVPFPDSHSYPGECNLKLSAITLVAILSANVTAYRRID